MKLAIIDGDGVLWDNQARMEVAEKAAVLVEDAMKLEAEKPISEAYEWAVELAKKAALWSIAFDPALIALDRHIPINNAHVSLLIAAGWHVVILSSNPETTRERRQAWLTEHGYDLLPLYLKDTGDDADPRDRYVKTPQWKVNQVYHLLEQYGDQVDTLLFVDDEPKNRDAIQVAFGDDEKMSLIVTDSLDLAVSLLEGQPKDFMYKINPEG